MNLTETPLGPAGDMEATTMTTKAMVTTAYPCDGATDEDLELYAECAYWLDGIGQVTN